MFLIWVNRFLIGVSEALEPPVKRVLKIICWMTGAANWTVATVTFWISLVIRLAVIAITLWAAKGVGERFAETIWLAFLFVIYMLVWVAKEEIRHNSNQDVIAVPKSVFETMAVWRVIFFISGAVVITTDVIMRSIDIRTVDGLGSLLFGFSLYTMTILEPPKKSMFEKAWDRIKSIRIPSFRPAPIPVG